MMIVLTLILQSWEWAKRREEGLGGLEVWEVREVRIVGRVLQ